MNMQLKADGDFVYQTGETGKIVRVRVHYIKTQGMSRRGIYVSVEPWTITPDTGSGYSGESTILMSDASVFVERLARVKPSAVALIASRLDAHAPAFASMMIREGRERTKLALQAFFTDGSVPVVPTVHDELSSCTCDTVADNGFGECARHPEETGAGFEPKPEPLVPAVNILRESVPEPQPEPVKTPDGWSFV